jgi:hypothetical protein
MYSKAKCDPETEAFMSVICTPGVTPKNYSLIVSTLVAVVMMLG